MDSRSDPAMRALSALEARVVGVLVEKAHTVPDSYPLSLNALQAGCNQKTAREPVMTATESELLAALDDLKALSLVVDTSGSRVTRWQHNLGRALQLPSQSVALLATLVLRGPQTAAELRANSERLHAFADVSSVEGFLDELASRPEERGGPLVLRLPRAPGAREPRWVSLLCGPVEAEAAARPEPADAAGWQAAHAALAQEVAELRAAVQHLYDQLGVARP